MGRWVAQFPRAWAFALRVNSLCRTGSLLKSSRTSQLGAVSSGNVRTAGFQGNLRSWRAGGRGGGEGLRRCSLPIFFSQAAAQTAAFLLKYHLADYADFEHGTIAENHGALRGEQGLGPRNRVSYPLNQPERAPEKQAESPTSGPCSHQLPFGSVFSGVGTLSGLC